MVQLWLAKCRLAYLLLQAALSGDYEIVEVLLKNKLKPVDVNSVNPYGFNAIMSAVRHDHDLIVGLLADKGASLDLTIAGQDGKNAVCYACEQGSSKSL